MCRLLVYISNVNRNIIKYRTIVENVQNVKDFDEIDLFAYLESVSHLLWAIYFSVLNEISQH